MHAIKILNPIIVKGKGNIELDYNVSTNVLLALSF
jgi:hypothetical protein